MTQQKITDDLSAMLAIVPPDIARAVDEINDSNNLLEIILDLGRSPTARYLKGEISLREKEISHDEIDYVVQRVGAFDADNRAGIERTLHRISAIKNRRGQVVGLTCRVGRAVYGTLDIIEDLIISGKSILLLGRPGVGKTTLLREAARVLAQKHRVVIVDTSNEIGGDGDVPHPAVGQGRRMQVATPALQHEVMIEAVENHSPEAIVIDEIGRELEAQAARTIAERGVQLIGTAHGNTLDNLLLNPTLSDLVGGIESVTLSDEEARRRGTQKTVLERRSPPTFDVLIEIQTRDQMAVHKDVAAAVDALLRGKPLPPEIRSRELDGRITVQKPQTAPHPPTGRDPQGFRRGGTSQAGRQPEGRQPFDSSQAQTPFYRDAAQYFEDTERQSVTRTTASLPTIRIYPYGVARNRLAQAAKYMQVPTVIVREASEAEVLVTLRAYFRKRQRTIVEAENRGVPIYVLRANTISQMERFLGELYNLSNGGDHENGAEDEILGATRSAIEAVLNGERYVELPPASAYIRRLQHQLARESNLVSHSYGKDPYRRVRIFREQAR